VCSTFSTAMLKHIEDIHDICIAWILLLKGYWKGFNMWTCEGSCGGSWDDSCSVLCDGFLGAASGKVHAMAFANASVNVHVMDSLRAIAAILWPADSADCKGGITDGICDGSAMTSAMGLVVSRNRTWFFQGLLGKLVRWIKKL